MVDWEKYRRWDLQRMEFEQLLGKTLISIENEGDERLTFKTADETFIMYHDQDCCESVSIEDICGDLNDLLNYPILLAEEVTSNEDPADKVDTKGEEKYRESFTWTFYKLSTIKGSVTIRWYGTSNGYYSERVSFYKV